MTFNPTRRAALAAPLLLGAAACSQEIGERPLRGADTHAAGYPTVQAVDYFGELLSRRTDGRLRLRNYPGGQLGGEGDTLEITMFGGLDFNRVNLAPLNVFEPTTFVPALPFLFSSTDHMRRSLDGEPGRAILESLRPLGMIGLCFYDSGQRSFYNRVRPVRTPADLRGLKIRVQPSDLYVAMVSALGANPTPIPFGEVYQALVQGVVDGAENNMPSYDDTRHHEVARYFSATGHVMAPEVFVMSARTWDRLTPADRDLVMECADESVPYMREIWDAREASSRQNVIDAGCELIEDIDVEPFRALMAPVWDRFIVSDLQQRLVRDIQAME